MQILNRNYLCFYRRKAKLFFRTIICKSTRILWPSANWCVQSYFQFDPISFHAITCCTCPLPQVVNSSNNITSVAKLAPSVFLKVLHHLSTLSEKVIKCNVMNRKRMETQRKSRFLEPATTHDRTKVMVFKVCLHTLGTSNAFHSVQKSFQVQSDIRVQNYHVEKWYLFTASQNDWHLLSNRFEKLLCRKSHIRPKWPNLFRTKRTVSLCHMLSLMNEFI